MGSHGFADVDRRLEESIEIDGDCWLWTAGRTKGGYARMSIMGREAYVHRYLWERENGPVPDGMELDHKQTCPKRCVRPDHLRAVTHKVNAGNVPARSGVRGVSWYSRDQRWHARVSTDGKTHHVGYFDDLSEAEAAVKIARTDLIGADW